MDAPALEVVDFGAVAGACAVAFHGDGRAATGPGAHGLAADAEGFADFVKSSQNARRAGRRLKHEGCSFVFAVVGRGRAALCRRLACCLCKGETLRGRTQYQKLVSRHIHPSMT